MEENTKKSPISEREEEILKYWQDRKIFEKTLDQTKKGKPFVFYDGPPFATGLPHYGHLLAGTIKDVIPRYQTMRGRFVRRQWGWDCHGLPVENLIEKELNLKHKKDIEGYGVEKFNEAAQNSVLRYDAEWKEQVGRMGRFVDMEKSYKTMDASYTESIWWAFKTLYDKGLIYEGYKPMHICPRCETPLANAEVAQGYKDITDISVTVKFQLKDEPDTHLLAWTTTPWTLPGNVALAVGKDIDYVKVKTTNPELGIKEQYILAKEKAKDVLKDRKHEIVTELKGKDLIGKSYIPPFDYYFKDQELKNRQNGWKIYPADFVTTETGTGIVHIAPAFGEDDMNLGKKFNLPFIQHVSMDGTFKKEVSDFAGMEVKPKDSHQKTDIEIIKNLAGKNLLFAKEKITHSYPHCWRCDTPLLNYAANSWFVEVTKLRAKLLSENKKVKWVPETIGKGRFHNWLSGARDWAISRARYWGAPLPVWKCESCEKDKIIGSLEELKKFSKKSLNNYILMRHGQALNNTLDTLSSDPENKHHLTELGRGQTIKAAKLLRKKKIDLIISSPFARTKETAEIIKNKLGLKDESVILDRRLAEVNFGDFDGKKSAEYHSYFSNLAEKFTKRVPGGENLSDIKKRTMNLLVETDKKYSGKNILIITHEYPAWMLASGVSGAGIQAAISVKEKKGEFLKNAEMIDLPFCQLPLNDEYETDFHRPHIDKIKLACPCGGEMKRIPDVFDCWFESGSMPYAQFHYPFENKKEFKKNFPADFIAEGVDQTRGWFYSSLVLSAGLFGKAPFRNVVVNGLVLAEDGQKMSKRLKNYPEPMEVVSKYGADAVRFELLSMPTVKGEDANFSEKAVDEVYKKLIVRLLNIFSFYEMYGGSSSGALPSKSPSSENILDKWILARLNETGKEVSSGFDAYELDRATKPIAEFIDDMSTWYIRRSRERFKSEDQKDRLNAMLTTRFALLEFAKVIAPAMPFLAENIYLKLGGEKESVHLEKWPEFSELKKHGKKLVEDMKRVRRIVSLALEKRAAEKIKVRQPLTSLKIKDPKFEVKSSRELMGLIKDEVNVKEVIFGGLQEAEVLLDTKITTELKIEGDFRETVRFIQDLRKKGNLKPSERAVLSVWSDPKGADFLKSFEVEIKKTAGLEKIVFAVAAESLKGEKSELSLDGMKFQFTLASA